MTISPRLTGSVAVRGTPRGCMSGHTPALHCVTSEGRERVWRLTRKQMAEVRFRRCLTPVTPGKEGKMFQSARGESQGGMSWTVLMQHIGLQILHSR